MSSLNLNFSSSFFTASLPLTQSQIPNPKFPQFQHTLSEFNRLNDAVSQYHMLAFPIFRSSHLIYNQVSFRTDSSFSSVRLSLFFWKGFLENFFSFSFLLRNNFARRVWKMLVLMILCWLSVFLENVVWDKKIILLLL